ncbi:MAG: mechanosensitive ion channel [Rikenellaceae bacterium]|nr:mechanosensitive ion channel [Rikenellaceae bacterium]
MLFLQLNPADTDKLQDADSTVKAKIEHQIEEFSHMSPEEILRSVASWLIELGLKILVALAIWFIGRWLIRKLRKFMNNMFERRHVDPTLRTFLDSLVSITLTIILIVITVDVIGLSTTSFLALFASAGLALGVALSGTLQNFAGGVMLLLLKPFRVGDYIDAQGKAGTVKTIQLFNTVITTPDNQTVIIPNGPLSTGIINNTSREPYKQSTWNLGVNPGADFPKLKENITAILDSNQKIIKDKGYNIEITRITGLSIKVLVQAWTKAADQQAVIWQVNRDIYSKLPPTGIYFTDP